MITVIKKIVLSVVPQGRKYTENSDSKNVECNEAIYFINRQSCNIKLRNDIDWTKLVTGFIHKHDKFCQCV